MTFKRMFILIVILVISLFLVLSIARSQSPAIIELNSDYSWNWVGGSPTPVVITATPRPTQTPWIITATPSDVPTQEIFTPTFTPSPTPPQTCLLKNTSGGYIRVRNLPSTVTGTVTLGFISPDQYIHPEAYYIGPTYKWWKIWWDDITYGWTADFYEETTSCADVPYEDPFQVASMMEYIY